MFKYGITKNVCPYKICAFTPFAITFWIINQVDMVTVLINLDIKKIRELDGLFRVRKDKLRIIFYDIYDDGPPIILEAGKRKDV